MSCGVLCLDLFRILQPPFDHQKNPEGGFGELLVRAIDLGVVLLLVDCSAFIPPKESLDKRG
jgi:hypothetical protein